MASSLWTGKNKVKEQQEVDADFLVMKQIFYTLDMLINKIQGKEKPHIIHETCMHTQNNTVWWALLLGGVNAPFLENDEGQTGTVNSSATGA